MKCVSLGLVLLFAIQGAVLSQDRPVRPDESVVFRVAPKSPGELQELFRYTGERMPLVSAHRGGPDVRFPENCSATFANTLRHAFAIMEIDPRMTKDGQIVVHHDATLERTTTGRGEVASKTLEELRQLKLKDLHGNETEFGIPTLDELLEWARGKTVLVLDQKDVSVEMRVKKIEEHAAESYAMLIVYSFKEAQACFALNPNIMMEVMIPSEAKLREFDRTGIPWKNVVAFVGHTPPEDKRIIELIHAKGACCMAGTSRNLDKRLMEIVNGDAGEIKKQYQALLNSGVDLIETDVPTALGKLLFQETGVPASKAKMLFSHRVDSR
jgi:glycerophosphoryl diester phosphodiesterase